ncbi:unnamed protein product [Thlaspi arvense]|uniref:Retrotransposon gag domain-containing protein n=1 Tax=Thlaspi arvense TaxID=13288 RepID=A0AAU9T9Y1_THLAR|nr:unnamed protein product [Thlaspi arvense]
MTDMTTIATQLALIMECLQSLDEIKEKVQVLTDRTKTLEAIASAQCTDSGLQKGKATASNLQQGPTVKFSTEELSEVEGLSATKGSRRSTLPTAPEAGTSAKTTKHVPALGGGLIRDEHKIVVSGRPWPTRAVGRERDQRHTDGGGEWHVQPIGAATHENRPNYAAGDFRVQEERTWKGGYEAHDDRDFSPEQCVVPAARIEFPSYDGTTNAVEWLQKCDDYFADQRVFNDDAKIRQATFVLTGQAYHWNNNLRRLVTNKLSWGEFKRICKSRFGRADSVNPVRELSNLRHTGTVDDYCNQFEECLGQQTRLTGDQQLW